MTTVKIDMTGWKMCDHGVPNSRLTVVKQVEDYVSPNGERKAQWLCECNCESHNQIIATGADIRSGNTQSCGCLKRESTKNTGKNNQKINHYEPKFFIDEYGEYGVGYRSNIESKFYFDKDDYFKINKYNWMELILSDTYHRLIAFIQN